jgi:homoserine kinase
VTPFSVGPVTVDAPATSANLGPGFDALGLALTLRDRVTVRTTGAGLQVDVEGFGADSVPRDESHLVVRAARAAFDAMGVGQPGLSVTCRNVLPHGRGLGSSAAAIVAGVVAARALVTEGARRLDDAAALRLAAAIEGHPDNVAAALLGGLTIAWDDGDGVRAARLNATGDVVVLVPPNPVPTDLARALLPAAVPHADAARNAGRAALLVAALGGRADLLLPATRDWLHQAYRAPAMPDSGALVASLRAGGVPAVVSGAGPAVLAFTTSAASAEELAASAPPRWTAHVLAISPVGARVRTGG